MSENSTKTYYMDKRLLNDGNPVSIRLVGCRYTIDGYITDETPEWYEVKPVGTFSRSLLVMKRNVIYIDIPRKDSSN